MRRLRSQEGSTLIMLIGIAAALAVLTATLVMVTANMQHASEKVNQRDQTFNVAESGLDDAVYTMGQNWPATGTTTLAVPTGFQAQFPASDNPTPPATEAFLTYQLTPGADENSFYLTSTANEGSNTAVVRALIQKKVVGLSTLLPGVGVYAGGNLTLTGNSTISGGSGEQVYGNVNVTGNINYYKADTHGSWTQTGNITGTHVQDVPPVPTFDQVMPASAIAALKTAAQATPTNGTVYNGLTYTGNNNLVFTTPIYVNGNLTLNGNATFQAPAVYVNGNVIAEGNTQINVGGMYVTGTWTTTGNVQFTNLGPTYVAGNVTMTGNGNWSLPLLYSDGTVSFSGNETIGGNGVGGNTAPSVVYSSQGISWNGNGAFWGLFATQGSFTGNGNGTVNGQIAAKGNVSPTGNFSLTYSSDVNNSLRTSAATMAQLAPGKWQEIQGQ